MISDTSLMAFDIVRQDLGDRQLQVYKTIKKLSYCNNQMISKYLSLPINSITPRCNELRKKGLIEFSHITNCPYTKHKSKFWKLKLNNLGGIK